MKFFKNFFKIFCRKIDKEGNNLLSESTIVAPTMENRDFLINLKENVKYIKKKKIEMLVCVGDGLGISNKIRY